MFQDAATANNIITFHKSMNTSFDTATKTEQPLVFQHHENLRQARLPNHSKKPLKSSLLYDFAPRRRPATNSPTSNVFGIGSYDWMSSTMPRQPVQPPAQKLISSPNMSVLEYSMLSLKCLPLHAVSQAQTGKQVYGKSTRQYDFFKGISWISIFKLLLGTLLSTGLIHVFMANLSKGIDSHGKRQWEDRMFGYYLAMAKRDVLLSSIDRPM